MKAQSTTTSGKSGVKTHLSRGRHCETCRILPVSALFAGSHRLRGALPRPQHETIDQWHVATENFLMIFSLAKKAPRTLVASSGFGLPVKK
jgi:hypothetical protein